MAFLTGLAQSKELQGVKQGKKPFRLILRYVQVVHWTVFEQLGGTAVDAGEVVVIPIGRGKHGFSAGQVTATHQAPLLQLA